MSQDFSKGKIYKITNDYNNDVYVGSTCDLLTKRFSNHKMSVTNDEKKNRPLYKLMNEIGFERFRIELIEDYPCQDKYELRQREGHHIREIGTLNKKIEGRTTQEYYIDNKNKIQEYKKEWSEVNKDKIQEYKKEFYLNNKQKITEKNQEYYQQTKFERNKLFLCECGIETSKHHFNRHKKSNKHINLMKTIHTQAVC